MYAIKTEQTAVITTVKQMLLSDAVLLPGQVLKNYLQSGILEGSPVYSASAEAEFAATQSDEELAQLQVIDNICHN